jgi:hypothetical protein
MRTVAAATLAAVIVIGLAHVGHAQRYPSVPSVVDARIIVRGGGGEGLLSVAVSQDWSRPLPQVSRAVVVVHVPRSDRLPPTRLPLPPNYSWETTPNGKARE